MQMSFPFDKRSKALLDIHERLQRRFGPQGPFLLLDPVSQLIKGLIGARTHGDVTKPAFEALLTQFGSWEAVRDANVIDIENTIRKVTYFETKAQHLKAALSKITRLNDALTLENLTEMHADEALDWLERLPGVGRKVAAATLNFSTLRKAVLVIDTHHLRILRRLGLVRARANYSEAYDAMMLIAPPNWSAVDYDDHHQLMKVLGQTICKHHTTSCFRCPLQSLCPTAAHPPPLRVGTFEQTIDFGAART